MGGLRSYQPEVSSADGRHRFRRARADDDAAIRAILRDVPVGGGTQLTFEREPSFHGSFSLCSHHDAVVAYDRAGRLDGLIIRSIHDLVVSGALTPVGIISGLRVRHGAPGIAVLRGMAETLRACAESAPAAFHLATITAGNSNASAVLLKRPLRCFPKIEHRADLLTAVRPIRRIARGVRQPASAIKLADARELLPPEELQAVNLGAVRALFSSDGHLVAAGSVSDVRSERQIRIAGRSAPAAWPARVAARVLELAGYPRIPRATEHLELGYVQSARLGSVTGGDKAGRALSALLDSEARSRGLSFLSATFTHDHPLAHVLSRSAWTRYQSGLYQVIFDESRERRWAPSGPVLIDGSIL